MPAGKMLSVLVVDDDPGVRAMAVDIFDLQRVAAMKAAEKKYLR